MKISQENKEEIQWFVYFLFKGTLSNELIGEGDYISCLISKPERLVICFEVFAASKSRNKSYKESVEDVTKYITSSEYNRLTDISQFWKEFIRVSTIFCHNKFELPVKSFILSDLNGCGTDAVSYFAVWTNTLEIDKYNHCINMEFAARRANERLLLWDLDSSYSIESFSNDELEQEIH